MTARVVSQSTRIHLADADESSVPVDCAYRLGKAFAAIHFEEDGTGRFAILPKGATVQVIGISRMGECFEVQWESRLYSVFQVDLRGAWAIRLAPMRVRGARGA